MTLTTPRRVLAAATLTLGMIFTGQVAANPAAYAATTTATVQQCKDAYAGLDAMTRAGWPAYVIAANKAIIDQKCAGVYSPA